MPPTAKRIAVCAIALVTSACGSPVPMTATPLEGWEQTWLDTDADTRIMMCGTFAGEVPLGSGEVGAEALWKALERDDYVVAVRYDDWYEFMQRRCAEIDATG